MHALVHQEQLNMEIAPYFYYKLNDKVQMNEPALNSSSKKPKAKIGIQFGQDSSGLSHSLNDSGRSEEAGFVPSRRNDIEKEGGYSSNEELSADLSKDPNRMIYYKIN